MPAIVTHNIFAKDIQNKLKLNINDNYYIFSQSHDILYYNVNKNIRQLAHSAHVKNTQFYFINIIEYIKNNNLTENADLLSYLYGSITHYVLDSTLHPYLFYKNGIDSSNHRVIEKNIDKLFYENKTNKKYKDLKIHKEIIKKAYFSDELIKCINYVYKKTYNIDNVSKYYLKSIKESKLLFHITSYDKLGIKLFFYKIIDKLFKTKLYCLSNHIEGDKKYLNKDKNKWNHPSIKEEKYDLSFNELYDLSIKKCITIIKEINNYFNNKITINELIKYIPNISYTTGLDISKNKKMNYFE